MRLTFIIVLFLLFNVVSFGQVQKAMKKMGTYPVVFLDSVEIDAEAMEAINPFDISNIRVIQPKKAKKLVGNKGNDGAVYITTVKAAKISYWNFFRNRSDHFNRLINSPQADSIVQYVLNGQALSDSAAPGSLFLITDKNFKSLQVIDKEKLLSDNVIPKRYVVSITVKRSKELLKTRNRN